LVLGGGWVPAGHDRVRATLTAPAVPTEQPVRMGLDGRAVIDGREICRTAVPAEDMVQAFVYHHLVPADELLVCVTGRRRGRWAAAPAGKGRARPRARSGSDDPAETQSMAAWDQLVKLPAGGTVRLPLAAPVPAPRGRVEYQLSEPPDGISIETEAAAEGDLALVLQADAAKVRPGQQGNLIVNALVVGIPPRSAGGPKGKPRRLPLGSLPAIRFEIVAP
jgi:hypothetical protein